ncbi:MAG: exo-alpha-sialidase [Planctomycetales bacterium]|nr:exo-alpha-sialidase [Planctomycetales bacterium]
MTRHLLTTITLTFFTTQLFAVEYAEIIGPDDPGGKYKHPTTFTQLENGDLYLAFYGGSGEYSTDTAVYGSRQKAGEESWSTPKVIADTPFVSEGNPVVWQAPDGIVWLFYVVRYGETWSTSRIQAKISEDGAQTWSDPTVLAFEEGMMVRGRPIVLDSGEYLLPIYHETGHDTERVSPDSASLFLRFNPKTKKWTETDRIRSKTGNIQPAVVQLNGDHLLAFCRRGGGYEPLEYGYVVRSESLDGGQTWSEGQNTDFPNPNAAVDLLKLTSGNLLMAYNHSMNERDPLALALSTDGGKTFKRRVDVAIGGTRDFAYPYLNQTKDGKIHLTFTSKERSTINHAVFDEQELLDAPHLHHVRVYSEPGRFGGWPANHGIWSWGNEILVGFSAGYHKDLGPERHAIDRERAERHLLARSMDGGETWSIEDPAKQGALIPVGKALHGITPPGQQEKPWTDCPGGIDFTHPDFVMTLRMTDVDAGPSRFYYSLDRGRKWNGPFRLQVDDLGIAARTDYIVNGKYDCMVFLTAAKLDGEEGRPFCARSTDGGKSWRFVSWINEAPDGFGIMPSTVRVSPTELVTAVRRRSGTKRWIETYRSTDNGSSWDLDTVPAPNVGEGNPPSLIRLADKRLCLTYGHRAAPFGIRARVSADNGKTWQPEIMLRSDGGGRDVGYPRSVQRPDGKVVTVYYLHDALLSERYVGATIWEP